MRYSLYKDVFLVRGKSGACLYDFPHGKLYHFNLKGVTFIDSVLQHRLDEICLTEDDKKALKSLCDLSLICLTDEMHCNIGDYNELIGTCKHKWGLVWIEVTNKCNLKCIHCYENSGCNQQGVMSLDDFKYVVDELKDNDIRRIQLIGGEPMMLGTTIIDMLEYSIGKFDFIEIYTNGTLVRDNHIAYFGKNNINVALSLYSSDASMHDRVTQITDSFNKTMSTMLNNVFRRF